MLGEKVLCAAISPHLSYAAQVQCYLPLSSCTLRLWRFKFSVVKFVMTTSHKDYESIMSILIIIYNMGNKYFALAYGLALWLEAVAVTANKDLQSP